MARKKREWYEGASYHIMGRGNRRSAIYKDREDYRIFLKILQTVQERVGFDLHAYCLMTNHFHLQVSTFSEPIWKVMKPLMQNYAMWFNRKNSYEGHVFDSRYTSCVISDDRYFLEVSRYIHLNPVKARMVREPLAYEYSSYKYYLTEAGDACPKEGITLNTSRVMNAFRRDPCEQYRMFVEGKISHAEQEALIMKDMGENELWLPW